MKLWVNKDLTRCVLTSFAAAVLALTVLSGPASAITLLGAVPVPGETATQGSTGAEAVETADETTGALSAPAVPAAMVPVTAAALVSSADSITSIVIPFSLVIAFRRPGR